MMFQVGFAQKTFGAWGMRTDKWPGISMRAEMLDQLGWAIEGLAAIFVRTMVGLVKVGRMPGRGP